MKKPAKKTKTTKPNPVGRPTDYKPEYCKQLIEMMSTRGKSVGYCALQFGARTNTLYEWAKHYPEFSDAMARGKEGARIYWIEKGHEAVESRTPFREGMFKWIMAVRFGMREKQETIATNTNQNENLNIEATATPEEISAAREALKLASRFGGAA